MKEKNERGHDEAAAAKRRSADGGRTDAAAPDQKRQLTQMSDRLKTLRRQRQPPK
jgi:hypothetical protein